MSNFEKQLSYIFNTACISLNAYGNGMTIPLSFAKNVGKLKEWIISKRNGFDFKKKEVELIFFSN